MDAAKYGRSVALNCPTCGATQFSGTESDANEMLTCANCERNLTRSELVHENSENISEHVREIKAQVVKDMTKEIQSTLRSAFRGSKYIRFK